MVRGVGNNKLHEPLNLPNLMIWLTCSIILMCHGSYFVISRGGGCEMSPLPQLDRFMCICDWCLAGFMCFGGKIVLKYSVLQLKTISSCLEFNQETVLLASEDNTTCIIDTLGVPFGVP